MTRRLLILLAAALALAFVVYLFGNGSNRAWWGRHDVEQIDQSLPEMKP